MFNQLILLFLILTLKNSIISGINFNSIIHTSTYFKIRNPCIIGNDKFQQTQLIKSQFNNNYYVSCEKNFENAIININTNSYEFTWLQKLIFGMKSALIIIHGNAFEDLLKVVKVKINQRIYFMKVITGDFFETYTINQVRILNKLGMFYKNSSFILENEHSPNFLKRRSNFHGLPLKGLYRHGQSILDSHSKY